jgi:hypothetical protein
VATETCSDDTEEGDDLPLYGGDAAGGPWNRACGRYTLRRAASTERLALLRTLVTMALDPDLDERCPDAAPRRSTSALD